jgi:hypothetical protein
LGLYLPRVQSHDPERSNVFAEQSPHFPCVITPVLGQRGTFYSPGHSLRARELTLVYGVFIDSSPSQHYGLRRNNGRFPVPPMAGHVQHDHVGSGRVVSRILVGIEQCGGSWWRGLCGSVGLEAGSVAKVKGFDYRYVSQLVWIWT